MPTASESVYAIRLESVASGAMSNHKPAPRPFPCAKDGAADMTKSAARAARNNFFKFAFL